MYIFLSILIVLASLLLVGAVLIQKSKGGGLASNYASGNQYMGYRKTTDFIEKEIGRASCRERVKSNG